MKFFYLETTSEFFVAEIRFYTKLLVWEFFMHSQILDIFSLDNKHKLEKKKREKTAGYIFYSCSISFTMYLREVIKILQHSFFSCCGKEYPQKAGCSYTFKICLQMDQWSELKKIFNLLLVILVV